MKYFIFLSDDKLIDPLYNAFDELGHMHTKNTSTSKCCGFIYDKNINKLYQDSVSSIYRYLKLSFQHFQYLEKIDEFLTLPIKCQYIEKYTKVFDDPNTMVKVLDTTDDIVSLLGIITGRKKNKFDMENLIIDIQ